MHRQIVSFRLLWLVYFSSSFPASARSYSSYSVYTSTSSTTYQQSRRTSPAKFVSREHRLTTSRRSPFTTFATLTAAQTSPPLISADKKKERPLSYQDLSPLGRLVAGTVEVGTNENVFGMRQECLHAGQVTHTHSLCAFTLAVVVTVLEYVSGMVSGYLLGSVTDVPSLLFRRVDGANAAGGWNQVSSRFLRLHNKSLRWGSRYQTGLCLSYVSSSSLCRI
jgi:hypothetical protein